MSTETTPPEDASKKSKLLGFQIKRGPGKNMLPIITEMHVNGRHFLLFTVDGIQKLELDVCFEEALEWLEGENKKGAKRHGRISKPRATSAVMHAVRKFHPTRRSKLKIPNKDILLGFSCKQLRELYKISRKVTQKTLETEAGWTLETRRTKVYQIIGKPTAYVHEIDFIKFENFLDKLRKEKDKIEQKKRVIFKTNKLRKRGRKGRLAGPLWLRRECRNCPWSQKCLRRKEDPTRTDCAVSIKYIRRMLKVCYKTARKILLKYKHSTSQDINDAQRDGH